MKNYSIVEDYLEELFPNPGLTKTTSSGKTYYLFDKGYMIVNIMIDGKKYTKAFTTSLVYNPKIKTKLINDYLLPYIDRLE